MKTRLSSPANRNRARALTLVEVLVVVVMVMVLLVLLAWLGPVSHAKGKARRIGCASNLKEIGLATRLWATDSTNGLPPSLVTGQGGSPRFAADIWRHYLATTNELTNLKLLVCPADKRRPAKDLASLRNENISYFLSLDANETIPEAPLAGDRNLTTNGVAVKPGLLTFNSNSILGFTTDMHGVVGNVLFSDGSVRQATSGRLQEASRASGLLTNRLVIP